MSKSGNSARRKDEQRKRARSRKSERARQPITERAVSQRAARREVR